MQPLAAFSTRFHRPSGLPPSVAAILAAVVFAPPPSAAAHEPATPGQDSSAVQMELQAVSGSVSMLTGRGGNIGLSAGDDGAILIDDQFAFLTEQILEQVMSITDEPLRFVINTHWHGDHTGGNANLGGAGVIIVAHDNVRRRLSTDQFMEVLNRTTPASPPEALPVVTFEDRIRFYWNGDEIEVIHVPAAHTDGDAIIQFRKANVLHMGDTFFAGRYPFIDTGSGGDVDGVIAAADTALALCDDETRIIPGHGPLATPDDLRAYRDMIATVRERIASMVTAGKSLQEILADKPTADFDAAWNPPGAIIGSDDFVRSVHAGVTDGDRKAQDGAR